MLDIINKTKNINNEYSIIKPLQPSIKLKEFAIVKIAKIVKKFKKI